MNTTVHKYICIKVDMYSYQSYSISQNGICLKQIVQIQQISYVVCASLTKIIILPNPYEQTLGLNRHLLVDNILTTAVACVNVLFSNKTRKIRQIGQECFSNTVLFGYIAPMAASTTQPPESIKPFLHQ